MFACNKAGEQDLEKHFPHHNWPIVLGLVVVLNTGYGIFTPSIYQFITTPKTDPDDCWDEDSSERFWPGLASSETVYAWALMAYSIPETASMIFAGITAEKIPYTILILFTCALYAVGGVFYGQATGVWMVVVGRGLMGVGAAFADVTASSYIGEMGTRMDEIRKTRGKQPRKYTLYVAYSFVMNCTFILSFGATSIMSQFKDLEPYRWPGWFVTALSVLYALTVILCFSDPRPCRRLQGTLATCQCWAGLNLSLTLKSGWRIRFISYVFMISCGYMIGQVYAILTTLVSPVLSDQLGFSVEYTSFFFVGVSAAFILASVIQLVAKCLRLGNRVLFGLAILGTLTGVVLMGDWQAIGDDPCFFRNNVTASECQNSSLHLLDQCLNQSIPDRDCYWNPHSRVTREYCNTCDAACLSGQRSVDFYQFSVGVLLVSLTSPLGFVYVAAITSDITSVESQGTMLSLVIGSGAFARAVSPFWFVESYEFSGRHIYISMGVTGLCLLLVLLSLLSLYKNLAPKQTVSDIIVTRHASVNFLATLDPPTNPSIEERLDDTVL